MGQRRSASSTDSQLRNAASLASGSPSGIFRNLSGVEDPRHNMILAAVAVAAILALMALMVTLTNYIEDVLSENAEQQVVSFTEQAAFTSAGRLGLLQDEMESVQFQTDDLVEVQPFLASIKESFGLTGTWFIRADGQGVSWNGVSATAEELTAGLEITPLPEHEYGYSQNYLNHDGQTVRMGRKQLFAGGTYIGDFYQEVPLVLFTMPDELSMFDGRGQFMLMEAATGEVLVAPTTLPETTLTLGDSLYAYLEGAIFSSEVRSKAGGGYDSLSLESLDAELSGVEKLKSLVNDGECGVIRAVIDDRPSYIAVAPVTGSTWYACTIIPEENLRSQTTVVAATFQGVFAVVLLSLVGTGAALLMAYQRRLRSRNATATIELYGALSESVEMAVNLYSPRDHETTHIVAKADGVIGCSFDELMADPSVAESLQMSETGTALFERVRNDAVKQLERGDFSIVRPHESTRSWVEYAVRPLEFEGRHQLLIVLQDVTTEKMIQLSMKDAMEAAESANRAKTEFLSRMSHDIRTPMNVVIGMLQIAEPNIDNPAKLRTCLSKVAMASDQLLALINEVLDFSKIESGKIVLDRLPFSLEALIGGAADVARMQTEERDQTLVVSVENQIGDRFLGDKVRLNQMLMNLLSNAVKYTPEGGRIELSASVGIEKSGYYPITFKVADNGIGMSTEFQEHLFEPFTMEGRSRAQGTGLGTSIVKNIVTLMGGMITVESAVNAGTTFTVLVYLASADRPADDAQADPLDALRLEDLDVEAALSLARELGAEPVPPAAEEGEQVAGRTLLDESHLTSDCGAGLRILMAEDNDLNAEIAQELLESYGFAVERAVDGREACERFAAASRGYYDAVLMDVQMPRMDGYEATRTIRAMDRPDGRQVPIVAMSANAFSDDVAASLASGMDEHLSKPIQIKTVVLTVLSLVQERRA
uniref:histidine kinase n=1 Tax=Muribaculaceae bacterium Z82 TaxID=2304548 RepID=A0A7C9JEE1_9BACT